VPTTHITTAMRSVLGREFARRVSYPITSSDVRRWAIAVYYPEKPPIHFVRAGVDSDPYGELAVPQEFNPFGWMSQSECTSDDTDDIESGLGDPFRLLGVEGPQLERMVNGGIEVAYSLPMNLGDVITASTSITGLDERTGRLGLMLMVTTEAVFTNQEGLETKRERNTIIRY